MRKPVVCLWCVWCGRRRLRKRLSAPSLQGRNRGERLGGQRECWLLGAGCPLGSGRWSVKLFLNIVDIASNAFMPVGVFERWIVFKKVISGLEVFK